MCGSEFSIGNCFNEEQVKLAWESYLALLQVILKLKCMFHFVIDVELGKFGMRLMSCEDLEFVLKAIKVAILARIKVILGRYVQTIPKLM